MYDQKQWKVHIYIEIKQAQNFTITFDLKAVGGWNWIITVSNGGLWY
jgi:predicted secreted protein